jgi:hypothetical protein
MLVAVIVRSMPAVEKLHPSAAPLLALLVMLSLAVLGEAAQYPIDRDANLGDLLRDICGIAAGLLAVTARRLSSGRRAVVIAAALVFAVAGLGYPAARLMARTIVWLEASPAIGFEHWYERQLAASGSASMDFVTAPPGWAGAGHVVRVVPEGALDSEGLTLYGLPRDWAKYRTFAFTIAAESAEPHSLMLRIDSPRTASARRGRFRWRFDVGAQPREISIPVEMLAQAGGRRPLDIHNVVAVKILVEDAAGLVFYVDDVGLR